MPGVPNQKNKERHIRVLVSTVRRLTEVVILFILYSYSAHGVNLHVSSKVTLLYYASSITTALDVTCLNVFQPIVCQVYPNEVIAKSSPLVISVARLPVGVFLFSLFCTINGRAALIHHAAARPYRARATGLSPNREMWSTEWKPPRRYPYPYPNTQPF